MESDERVLLLSLNGSFEEEHKRLNYRVLTNSSTHILIRELKSESIADYPLLER